MYERIRGLSFNGSPESGSQVITKQYFCLRARTKKDATSQRRGCKHAYWLSFPEIQLVSVAPSRDALSVRFLASPD